MIGTEKDMSELNGEENPGGKEDLRAQSPAHLGVLKVDSMW